MEPSPSILSHPGEPRKAQRPSGISKKHLETEIKAFNNPFGRIAAGSGEWMPHSSECTIGTQETRFKSLFWPKEEPIRAKDWDSGEWSQGFGRMDPSLIVCALKLLFSSNHLHSSEWLMIRANGLYHSIEWILKSAKLVFFANQTPRAFRSFYPFCSLAYKYPLVSE